MRGRRVLLIALLYQYIYDWLRLRMNLQAPCNLKQALFACFGPKV